MNQQEISNQYQTKLHEQIIKVFHVSGMKLHDNLFGSKVYSNYQRVALIVLFQRSGKALRKFVDELFESKWPTWLGLREIPSYRTLHHWLTKWDVVWLRKFLNKTVFEQKPNLMAIDATGFDSWQRSRHYEQRLKDFGVHKKHSPYAKVDLLVDTKSRIIHDWVLRLKPRHDTLGASTMIKRIRYENVLILADRGYDSEPLHQEVFDSGNLMYAPVRDFKVKRPKGRHRRRCVRKNPLYGQRSIVESINFSLKSRFRSLRSKLHYMKKREFGWKIITYNLEKLSQSKKALLKLFLKIIILNRAL